MDLKFLRPQVMGILNVTPDSFSDGGLFCAESAALDRVETMLAEGVDIIDIGGESTRPGAASVIETEEIERVVAVVPGGAANVQDIYPLSPLQEGRLFHHRMASDGEPYLVTTVFACVSRDSLERHVDAPLVVIDRHDILCPAS